LRVLLHTSDICYSGSVDKFAVLTIVIPGKKLTCHSSHCVRCSGVYQSQARLAIRICQGFFGMGEHYLGGHNDFSTPAALLNPNLPSAHPSAPLCSPRSQRASPWPTLLEGSHLGSQGSLCAPTFQYHLRSQLGPLRCAFWGLCCLPFHQKPSLLFPAL
jgi:hypothetical protein